MADVNSRREKTSEAGKELHAAMDRLEGVQQCLDGFAVLMSGDVDAAGNVETLLKFLLSQQAEATAQVRRLASQGS